MSANFRFNHPYPGRLQPQEVLEPKKVHLERAYRATQKSNYNRSSLLDGFRR